MAGKPRLRVDLAGVGARIFRNTAHQRVEFHRLQKRDQALVIGLVHGEVADRDVELDLIVQRDELFRQPRLFSVVDQRLPALLLFDLRGALKQRFEIAEFADELRRGFHADAGHARHVVGRIADQRLYLNDFVRRHAELFHHLGAADLLVLHRIEHGDAIADELHQILVG